jgi:hypothetical protein
MQQAIRYGTLVLAGLCLGTALVAATPAEAGPPFFTGDPETVAPDHWEAYLFSAGARSHGDTSGIGPSLEVNYGALPDLQLHIVTGMAYDAPSASASQSGHTQIGVSDTELGVKYRFVDPEPEDWWPQIGIFPLLELPSGDASRGLGAGQVQAFLPIWAQKDFGAWTTYGGGGYWINPGPGNRNYWFTGWELQRHITEQLMLGGEVFYTTSSVVGRAGAVGFTLGGVYDFDEHFHLLFSAGRGGLQFAVNNAVANNPWTYYLGLQWTY